MVHFMLKLDIFLWRYISMKKRAWIRIIFENNFQIKNELTKRIQSLLVLNFYEEINSAITLSWTAS